MSYIASLSSTYVASTFSTSWCIDSTALYGPPPVGAWAKGSPVRVHHAVGVLFADLADQQRAHPEPSRRQSLADRPPAVRVLGTLRVASSTMSIISAPWCNGLGPVVASTGTGSACCLGVAGWWVGWWVGSGWSMVCPFLTQTPNQVDSHTPRKKPELGLPHQVKQSPKVRLARRQSRLARGRTGQRGHVLGVAGLVNTLMGRVAVVVAIKGRHQSVLVPTTLTTTTTTTTTTRTSSKLRTRPERAFHHNPRNPTEDGWFRGETPRRQENRRRRLAEQRAQDPKLPRLGATVTALCVPQPIEQVRAGQRARTAERRQSFPCPAD